MLNINTFFMKLCEELNISESLYKKLKERYKNISEYLESCSELNGVEIYPQGSVAIGTTVRPISQNEYDLDFVCEATINPFELFTLIKKFLKNNGHYSDLVEEKKRCVRLNYKENFHIDILPACPDKKNPSSTRILIPDKKLLNLLPSDPKGYALWFKTRGSSDSEYQVDKEIEALPKYQQASQKNNLQCIVQLMKRHRDIFFKAHPDQSPPSIILTTLCGMYYKKAESIFDSMINVVDAIKTNKMKNVYNPVNSEELLSEKWEENSFLYKRFLRWIENLSEQLEALKNENISELHKRLEDMFGEQIVRPVISEWEEERRSIHQNRKKLYVSSTGGLSSVKSSKTPVPNNTFFGDKFK